MKYIITESKLDAIIDSFITQQFGKLNHEFDGDRLILVTDDGEPMIVIVDRGDGPEVHVDMDVYGAIYNMFSMNDFEDIQSALIKWFRKHYNISVDDIFTFASGEENYIY